MSDKIVEVERFEKSLGLFDVYAICTGAMFASGFFLLPGIAAANTGPSVILAYFLSSLLMIPPLLSIAELSTAMPRAGGPYFFIHRSLGPHAGMIGGLGAWLVLVFKSAFALVGMGAYLAIFLDIPVKPVAVALTVAFAAMNIFGAKGTARLQNILVTTLVAIMTFYVVQGVAFLVGDGRGIATEDRFSPFLLFGVGGLMSTVGLVFVSYAGLTKVASVAEEIRNLDRTLPLGMALALLTVTVIYVGGTFVIVGALDPAELRDDLTPVATAGEVFLTWLPDPVGVILVVVAAVSAFASTGNAGILAASRFPLAMARDDLTWSGFSKLSRFGTPIVSVITTAAAMIGAIVFLDVERLAKLGSAFLLLIFALINLGVIIMREADVASYAPGFRSPLYPWIQWFGVVSAVALIFILGPIYIVFVLAVIVLATAWYWWYARGTVARRGGIYALFRRLGTLDEPGLDRELWEIIQERGATDADSFDQLVATAIVVDVESTGDFAEVARKVAHAVEARLLLDVGDIEALVKTAGEEPMMPTESFVALIDVRLDDLERAELALVRVRTGQEVPAGHEYPGHDLPEPATDEPNSDERGDVATEQPHERTAGDVEEVTAIMVLFGAGEQLTPHLRILAELATEVERSNFADRWKSAHSEQDLREVLLRRERFITVEVGKDGPTAELFDEPLEEVELPRGTFVALVRREERSFVPDDDTRLEDGDRVTIIGAPDDIDQLYERYGHRN